MRRPSVCFPYEDLAHLWDRVIVMRSGMVASELVGADVSLDRIVEQCQTGGDTNQSVRGSIAMSHDPASSLQVAIPEVPAE